MRAGREAGALDALQKLHAATDTASGAIVRAIELSEAVRAALRAEVDALAVRIVELAGVAHDAAALHAKARRLGLGGKS